MQRLLHNHNKKVKKKKTRARHMLFWKPCYKKRTYAHLMSLAKDNGAFIKSRHLQPVICIQTSKRTSSEQLFHLYYFTRVRSPRLLSLLGGELVGGEMGSWWRNSLVERWPDAVTTKRQQSTYTYDSHLPPLYQKIKRMEIEGCENCSSRLKSHLQILYRYALNVSGVLTLSKTRPASPDMWKC